MQKSLKMPIINPQIFYYYAKTLQNIHTRACRTLNGILNVLDNWLPQSLSHLGIRANGGLQYNTTFQGLLMSFVEAHKASLTSLAIPSCRVHTEKGLDFILSLCAKLPKLKNLGLIYGRSYEEQSSSNVIYGRNVPLQS
jgi:hypothetical protein